MRTSHTVRFSEVDAAGIAFFSRVFEWAHHAFEEALVARGLALDGILDGPWMMPLAHAEADYRAPMRLGQTLTIDTEVADLGTTSITWRFVVCDRDGVVCAEVRHVHVCISRDGFEPMALPPRLRAALEAGP